METKSRSWTKAVIWTAIGLGSMLCVGWLTTGSMTQSWVMAAANTVLGFTSYIIYERVWAKITWGRNG